MSGNYQATAEKFFGRWRRLFPFPSYILFAWCLGRRLDPEFTKADDTRGEKYVVAMQFLFLQRFWETQEMVAC